LKTPAPTGAKVLAGQCRAKAARDDELAIERVDADFHGDAEVLAVVDPAQWTAHGARETGWAIQRTLQAAVVFALRLVEVSAMQIWRMPAPPHS
jgi:hypothetical protein